MLLSKADTVLIKKMFDEFDSVLDAAHVSPDFGTPENTMRLYLWNIEFFHENPHFLFAAGFDEVRYIQGTDRFIRFLNDPILNPGFCPKDEYALFRWQETGVWYWLNEAPFMGGEFRLYRIDEPRAGLCIPVEHVLRKIEKAVDRNDHPNVAVLSPLIWTPKAQEIETTYLQDAASGLLAALNKGQCSLSDVSWRDLENIVAELLRDRGLEIHRVVERPQGGRDLVVRGELLPGELTYMAVEVKHRPAVGVAHLRAALKASEEFPALLFVTSGRFTAGVIKEKLKHSNQLRLLLKDGTALSQMIRSYGIARHGGGYG